MITPLQSETLEQVIQRLLVERNKARYEARVLASSWKDDARPPQDIVSEALKYAVDQRVPDGEALSLIRSAPVSQELKCSAVAPANELCRGKETSTDIEQCPRCLSVFCYHCIQQHGCQPSPQGGAETQDWTAAEWENLARLANTLQKLMVRHDRQNRAWRAKLRITLDSLAGYLPLSRGDHEAVTEKLEMLAAHFEKRGRNSTIPSSSDCWNTAASDTRAVLAALRGER